MPKPKTDLKDSCDPGGCLSLYAEAPHRSEVRGSKPKVCKKDFPHRRKDTFKDFLYRKSKPVIDLQTPLVLLHNPPDSGLGKRFAKKTNFFPKAIDKHLFVLYTV